MGIEEQNMELMQTLDDAWNAQDLDIFARRHKPDVIVHWPGKLIPTYGIAAHTEEAIEFFKAFPDGKEIPPTGKSFEVDLCTVARWNNMKIAEEYLFYDLLTFLRQIGLSDSL